MGYKRKARVLFLSYANNCCSQLAEAFANALGSDWIEARSAGFEPQPIDPLTVAAMRETGVQIAANSAKYLDDALLHWADMVVTLDPQSDTLCPALPPGVQKRHYPFPDAACGTIESCRMLRDEVRTRIEGMIGGMKMLQRNSAEP